MPSTRPHSAPCGGPQDTGELAPAKHPLTTRKKVVFAALVLLAGLGIAEGLARCLYHPPSLRTAEELGASYEPHPYLGYTGEPPLVQHGQEAEDAIRIACLGGSTTRDRHPPLLRGALAELGAPSDRVVVYDASCPGYTTMESQLALMIYVLPKRPDCVVVMHAHNDVQVRLCPGFRPDYAHYRINPWRRLSRQDLFVKQCNVLLDCVRLVVLVREAATGYVTKGRMLENYVCTQALPSPESFRASSVAAYEQHMHNIYFACKGSGADVVFVTQPLAPCLDRGHPKTQAEFAHLGPDMDDAQIDDLIACYFQGQQECNDAVRRLCQEHDVPLVDWAREASTMSACELFQDHVHLNDLGNQRLAAHIARKVAETLERRRARGGK